jgi:hypothetical protein
MRDMQFGGAKVVVAFSVTDEEAKRFGNCLLDEAFFTSRDVSCMVSRSGETYVVDFPVKKGVEEDAANVDRFRKLGAELSSHVFHSAPVEDQATGVPIRMQNRRMTRLTNAFSKKWANHQASLALHFATYNFITPHGTLTKNSGNAGERVKTTPAMAAGLTDQLWTMEELLMQMSKSTLG